MRGEQLLRECGIKTSEGSPPLARGTAPSSRYSVRKAGDHPRLRGEQAIYHVQTQQFLGSPPLARGTANTKFVPDDTFGITPACAGNRIFSIALRPAAQDHPRLRGEQIAGLYAYPSMLGSPPLARGTVAPLVIWIISSGITPACAGNSCRMRVSFSASRDHPRLRGEQISSSIFSFRIAGSPPLARGTADTTTISAPVYRITPACAGNRFPPRALSAGLKDHPRLRGEQS